MCDAHQRFKFPPSLFKAAMKATKVAMKCKLPVKLPTRPTLKDMHKKSMSFVRELEKCARDACGEVRARRLQLAHEQRNHAKTMFVVERECRRMQRELQRVERQVAIDRKHRRR